MNILRLKALVASNRVTNAAADWILDIYIMIRRKVTGSYTKNREDIIAWKLLEQSTGKKVNEIKYIDIGANHYRRGNNSYLFYESGARGILIEADPVLCQKLKKYRNKDVVVNAAMCGREQKEEMVPFYILSVPTRSSMDKRHVKQSVKEGLCIKKVIDVPCKTLNALLEEYHFEPDYLSIDIEGMDYKVLRSIDYSRYDIKVIVAEITGEKSENGETMDEYMKNVGYKIYGKLGSNMIFLKEGTR